MLIGESEIIFDLLGKRIKFQAESVNLEIKNKIVRMNLKYKKDTSTPGFTSLYFSPDEIRAIRADDILVGIKSANRNILIHSASFERARQWKDIFYRVKFNFDCCVTSKVAV